MSQHASGPGPASDPAEWTYTFGPQSYGPMSMAQLHAAAGSGMLAPQTPLYNVRTGATYPAAWVIAPHAPYPTAPPRAGDDAGLRMLLPVGRSGWAIAAGYLGLVSWLIWPLAPFSLLTAELGRRAIGRDSHKHGMGRVALGYIGGTIGTVGLLWVLVLSLSGS